MPQKNAHSKHAYADRWWSSDDGLRHYARDYAASSGRTRLPVICLHGLTRNSADFEGVALYIAALDRRVIVPDFRGRGKSSYDPNPMNYNIFIYAKDMIDLCNSLGIGSAIFVGTSMGGLTSMILSTMRPALIKSAVLNDVGPVLSPIGLARIAAYAGAKPGVIKSWEDAMAVIRRSNTVAFPDYNETDWHAFARRVYHRTKGGRLRAAYDPRIMEPLKAVVPGAFDMRPYYQSLAQGRRILLIRGALSDLLDDADARDMAVHDDFSRVDIDRAGHAPMLTEPQARAALIDFLESQP